MNVTIMNNVRRGDKSLSGPIANDCRPYVWVEHLTEFHALLTSMLDSKRLLFLVD